jgi:predicted Zn-dependent peptidase
MPADRTRLPTVGSDPVFGFPAVIRQRLSNGLAVRTIEHRNVPVVTLIALVNDGSGSDPRDRDGLAALTADMLDEGTGTLSAIGVSEALQRIGAEFDTDIGADATILTLTTLPRFAARGAALLADLLTRPRLLEEDFERVRQLRLDRLRQLRDVPQAVAEKAFLRMLYDGHPYAHLAIGSNRSLRATTLDDIRHFHQSAYRPSRTTLVAAGDFSHPELLALAEQAFGGWDVVSEGTLVTAPGDVEPVDSGPPRIAIVPRDRAAQSYLRIGHLTTRRSTPDYPALLVMNAVLGGQFVSRVNLKLREEKGYTYGARTGFDWRRGISPFSLDASVETKVTADAIRDSLAELEAIRGERPPNAQEMSLAKATLTRGYPRNFETVQQVARSVAQLVLYDLPDTYFEEFVPRVNAVSVEDVTRAAQRYLHPTRLSTLVVGDHGAIANSMRHLGLGEPVILSPED